MFVESLDPIDDVFVQHTRLLPLFLEQAVQPLQALTRFSSDGRNFHPHLRAKVQNLRFGDGDPQTQFGDFCPQLF